MPFEAIEEPPPTVRGKRDTYTRYTMDSAHLNAPPTAPQHNGEHNSIAPVPDHMTCNGTTPSGRPRLFACEVCKRAFARSEHLKRHERSHTKEKPFVCGVCQRRFSRRDLLLRHAQKLHAGCDDAIKRMRKRSKRAKKNDGEDEGDSAGVASSQGDSKRKKPNSEQQLPSTGNLLAGDFNFFFATNNDIHGTQYGTQYSSMMNFDVVPRVRHSSFSAASGNNYANASVGQQNAVEFATPQLAPVDLMLNNQVNASSANDSNNQSQNFAQNSCMDTNSHLMNSLGLNNQWLDPLPSLQNLPSLQFINNFSLNDSSTGTGALSSAISSTTNTNKKASTSAANPQETLKASKSASSAKSVSLSSSNPQKKKPSDSNDVFGYSFYDDDYVLGSQMEDFHSIKLSYPKLPSTYLQETASSPSTVHNAQSSHNTNTNDYILLSDLEVPNQAEKILSVGYSFYENNDSTAGNSNGLGWRNPSPSVSDSPPVKETQTQPLVSRSLPSMSLTDLFTNSTIDRINKVMKRYPFAGLPQPQLPTVEYLNHYVDNFRELFLSHYPFIHRNLLNEESMYKHTLNPETPKDYAPTICLPLLIATIGALYTNQKQHAADLYEYSRRCIHVYLDSRKKNDEAEKNTTHNSPLWLVQSLVLSVLYGLFGEYDESDLSIILRQVNALCTLVKVSRFNLCQFNHENIEINEEYFEDYITYQSKVRTVYMIFNISSMLSCLYNVDRFIGYKEIKCDLPDLESYWNCSNLREFKKVCIECNLNYSLNSEKILNDMVFNNQINYKVSEFGSIIIMNILLQYFFTNRDNALSNYSIGISPDHMNASNLVKNYLWEDMVTDVYSQMNMESVVLRNVAVIRSMMIDLSPMKEALWSRSWDKVSSEFLSLSPKTDDLIDACDYSVRTLSMMFINDVESSNFKKCVSLSLQWLFFNFFYIAKFLHKFERLILKQVLTGGHIKPHEARLMPKFFSIYLKIAKFLADLEQLLTRNFEYHDPTSQLALKQFDASKITFGYQRLVEAHYPKDVNMDNVVKIVSLRLSQNVLRIGEFVMYYIYKHEANFNIFKAQSEGLRHLRVFVEKDLA